MENWLGLIGTVLGVGNFAFWAPLNYRLQKDNHRLQQDMKKITLERDKRQAQDDLAQKRLKLAKLAFCIRAIKDRTYTFSPAKTRDFRDAIKSFRYGVPYLDEAVNLAFEATPEEFRDMVISSVSEALNSFKRINDLVARDASHPWEDDLRSKTVEIGGCNDYLQNVLNASNDLLHEKNGLLTARIPPLLNDSNVEL